MVLAAVGSLALALLVWARSGALMPLLVTAAAMLAFTLLDVREIAHQSDEGRTGLALLAGVLAALHLAATAVAVALATQYPNLSPGRAFQRSE